MPEAFSTPNLVALSITSKELGRGGFFAPQTKIVLSNSPTTIGLNNRGRAPSQGWKIFFSFWDRSQKLKNFLHSKHEIKATATILDKIYWNNEKIYNSNEPPPFTPDSMLLDIFQLQDANQHCFGGKRGRWKYEDEKN